MSSYGRNFDFRVPPQPEQRGARYVTPATGTPIPIGVPVEVTGTAADVNGRNPVAVATGATPKRQGLAGILVYEHAPAAFAGTDPARTTYSDLDTAPLGAPVQLASGPSVKVVLRNDDGTAFAGSVGNPGGATHNARVMVAGIGALQVGDFLIPAAAPDDATGYWAETATEADAWLVVTAVNVARGEVEARMTF